MQMKRLELTSRSLSISIILYIFIFLISCQGAGEKTGNNKTAPEKSSLACDTNYSTKYGDPQIRKKIDEAKWNLYLYSVIDTPKNENDSFVFKSPRSYASYPLVVDTLYIYKESTFILFSFCIDGELLTKDKAFELGVEYVPESISLMKTVNGKESRCIRWRGATDGDNLCIESLSEDEIRKLPKHFSKEKLGEMRKSTNRLIYPINPVVVDYIESNQKDLDPWFINEAKKRGVIK